MFDPYDSIETFEYLEFPPKLGYKKKIKIVFRTIILSNTKPKMPSEINLNVSPENENIQHDDETRYCLPDLNIEVGDLIPELNRNPNSPTSEISSYSLDLNKEPSFEGNGTVSSFEGNTEVGLEVYQESNNIGMYLFIFSSFTLPFFI